MILKTIAIVVLSYLIGSIPFSFIIARHIKGVDLRYTGEGNVGARNVWHVVGKKWGIVAAILDVLKGLVVFFLASSLSSSQLITWLAGVSVIVGHDFPIFLRGLGGKGAAAAMGFLLGMFPLPVLSSGLLMLILFLIFRRFHVTITIGMASLIIVWLPCFHVPLKQIIITTAFLLLLGIKRIFDEPHMKRVRVQSGWED